MGLEFRVTHGSGFCEDCVGHGLQGLHKTLCSYIKVSNIT